MITGDRTSFVGFNTSRKLKDALFRAARMAKLAVSAYVHNHLLDTHGLEDEPHVTSTQEDEDTQSRN